MTGAEAADGASRLGVHGHASRRWTYNRKAAAFDAPFFVHVFASASTAPPSVEWCSSLWLHVIQEVDPHYQRTIMVSMGCSSASVPGQWPALASGQRLEHKCTRSLVLSCRSPPNSTTASRSSASAGRLTSEAGLKLIWAVIAVMPAACQATYRIRCHRYLSASGYLPPSVKPFFIA